MIESLMSLFSWLSGKSAAHREVTALVAMALRQNLERSISNDYDAKRIATSWTDERPPRFQHDGIGGSRLTSTAMGEAFFLLQSRISSNEASQCAYEIAALKYLIVLSFREKLDTRLTGLDVEARASASQTLLDIGAVPSSNSV
jgi:hypothetical protein